MGRSAITALLFIPAASIFFACRKAPKEVTPIFSRDQVNIERGKDVEIIYSDSARTKVKVTGPTLLYYNDRLNPRQEFIDGTLLYFYDDQLNVQSTLKGKYALRDERKKETVVRDSVVWESKVDGRLETTELIWDEKENYIYSTKFVKIIQPGQTITGYGFKTNQDFTNWKIGVPKGNIKVDNLEKTIN